MWGCGGREPPTSHQRFVFCQCRGSLGFCSHFAQPFDSEIRCTTIRFASMQFAVSKLRSFDSKTNVLPEFIQDNRTIQSISCRTETEKLNCIAESTPTSDIEECKFAFQEKGEPLVISWGCRCGQRDCHELEARLCA